MFKLIVKLFSCCLFSGQSPENDYGIVRKDLNHHSDIEEHQSAEVCEPNDSGCDVSISSPCSWPGYESDSENCYIRTSGPYHIQKVSLSRQIYT